MSTKLNQFANATVGMCASAIEVATLQPLNYFKNMIQQRLPIVYDARTMYRGVGANIINMGSCTMVQFSVGGAAKNAILGSETRPLKVYEEMGAGVFAGVMSAFLGSPLELIMIQQQVKGGSTAKTIGSIVKPSTVGRGFIGTAVREGLWTCGYLAIPPIIRRQLRESFPTTFDSDTKARIPASLLGGLFGCYMTHPFDTIKTCMQGDIENKKFKGLIQTARIIYGENGITGFYRGAMLRYARMVLAVGLLDTLGSVIGPVLYPHKFE